MAKDFKVTLVGSNEDGTRIYCSLKYRKKAIAKGYFDFDEDKFHVVRFMHGNYPEGMTDEQAEEIFKDVVGMEYDW